MKEKLIVVGWDGADWEIARPLLEQGKMPQLQEMISRGASGKIRSAPPYLSPMLWTTMATGKSPAEHGIVGFREFNVASQSHQPIASTSRKTKAIWNMLSQEGWKTHVVGWFATCPAETVNGVVVSDLFAQSVVKEDISELPKGVLSPESKAADLASLRVSPDEIDMGLVEFFIPKLKEINLDRDPRPLALRKRLAELYTNHNTAVVLLQEEPTDFLTVYYHFIDWICHDFMELSPPQREGVCTRDFELYSGVVDAAYVLQDLLLRDLLRHADASVNCVVVSDHGFLSGDERPQKTANVDGGIAAWHRLDGLLVGAGPLFNQGVVDLRATLFDLAPTLLNALNLPVGEDMPGQVIDGMLRAENRVATIPSWDRYGEPYQVTDVVPLDSSVSEELLRQFADLGYVSAEEERQEVAEAKTGRENAWNLGIALMGELRLEEALPYLEEAYFYHPEASHKGLHLATCQVELGLVEESLRTQESLLDYGSENGPLSYHLALLARKRGAYGEALALLEAADQWGGNLHDNAMERGLILLLDAQYQEAEKVFRAELERRQNPSAELGLCRALVMQERFDEAEVILIETLRKRSDFSVGWFTLGVIYEKKSDAASAVAAYDKAIRWRPDFQSARGRKFLLERKVKEQSGKAEPMVFSDLDFSESPLEKQSRAQAERLAKIRAASQQRHLAWQKELDFKRSSENPISILEHGSKDIQERPTIVIVSGLPRSGTSLMMQMLRAGGVEIQADEARAADAHNPRGFFEWEPVLRLEQNAHRLSEAAGKAVKVVSSQLRFLPRTYTYKVIWMHRPIEEVAASQRKMLNRRPAASAELKEGEAMLRSHRDKILQSLRAFDANEQSALSLLELEYSDCLFDTNTVCQELSGFLAELLPKPEKMTGAIDKSLYRNRNQEMKTDA